MKIGLLSADKHCKSHIRALHKDGYNVTCLGARPSSIPSSYDVLVVRVASISHAGEAVARAWAKRTGKPAIYEDGLTSIRRELSVLCGSGRGLTRDVELSAVEFNDIYTTLFSCAESYREARPDDSPEDMARALRGVLYTEHPNLASEKQSMIPSIVSHFYTQSYTPKSASKDIMPSTFNIPVYAGSPALMPDVNWAKVYVEAKIRAGYDEATKIISEANHLTITSFTNSVKVGVFSQKVKTRWERLLRGKPLTAAFVMFILVPELTKMEMMQAYRLVTDKGMDSRLRDVVEWALGGWAQEVVAVPVDPVVNENVTDSDHSKIEADHDPALVADNTKAIVDLMDDLSTFKNEIRAGVAQIGAGLESRIKALEDFRATQGMVGEDWEARIESRIKDLEGCWDDLRGQVPTLIGQAAGAVEHRLRGDISNAFDALAAEQPSGDLSSNPFAALEQVKVALKAAGFKGTLTLTIE